MTDDLARARWSRFVERALTAARARGLTDKAIQQATGLQPTTWHRWKRQETRTMPDLAKVRAFCQGLNLSVDDAMTALGVTAGRDNPEPAPPVDPDLQVIMRRLMNPRTPAAEKLFIRESLRMLAERVERTERQTRRKAQ